MHTAPVCCAAGRLVCAFAWPSRLLHRRVCSQLAMRPSAQGKSDPSKRIALVVQSLMLLRETLQALPCLAQALKHADSSLLQVRR